MIPAVPASSPDRCQKASALIIHPRVSVKDLHLMNTQRQSGQADGRGFPRHAQQAGARTRTHTRACADKRSHARARKRTHARTHAQTLPDSCKPTLPRLAGRAGCWDENTAVRRYLPLHPLLWEADTSALACISN